MNASIFRQRPSRLGMTAVAALAAGGACSSDNGHGEVTGVLDVPACTFKDGTKSLKDTKMFTCTTAGDDYCGTWNHFIAEPFDSTTPRFPENQINIRMQNVSGGWEFADALFFWVADSYEVARCVRGHTNADGTPDWDVDACDRSPEALGPSGEGRMRIGTEGELVTSHFVLQESCPGADLSASGLGRCGGGSCPDVALCPGRDSWIAFSHFGPIPSGPTSVLVRDFKVSKDDLIEASHFHLELCDQSTIDGQLSREVPVPIPAITGTLDGSFSFKLQPNFR